MLYLIDAQPNGLPTRVGSTNCHCEWQIEDGCWPRDCFRSLMGFIRDHRGELGGIVTAGSPLPDSDNPTQPAA